MEWNDSFTAIKSWMFETKQLDYFDREIKLIGLQLHFRTILDMLVARGMILALFQVQYGLIFAMGEIIKP